jgi:hypothetical protein
MFWLIDAGVRHIIFNMKQKFRQGVAYPQILAVRGVAKYFERST